MKPLEKYLSYIQSILDSIQDAILVIDTEYNVVFSNNTAKLSCEIKSPEIRKCYQFSHNMNEPCNELDHPCPIREVLKTRMPVTVTHKHKCRNEDRTVEIVASPIPDSSGNIIQIIEVCRDITEKLKNDKERKNLENRLILQQKEESIITLAGGIAHDFNNILMAVLGYAELLKIKFHDVKEATSMIDNIIVSAERMASLTKQLLAYARLGIYHKEPLMVNDIIIHSIELAHKGKALETEVVMSLSNEPLYIMADMGQISQALVNVFTNAFESMQDMKGRLSISAVYEKINTSWECPIFHEEHPSGDYVHITITDTGHGIPHEIQKKIFDPFFSTRFPGRGLGLAATSGIIKDHDGCIYVESNGRHGSKFHVYLPCVREISQIIQEKPIIQKEPLSGTVLVVDDEKQILSLLEEMLIKAGMEVVTAETGKIALEKFRDEHERYRLAILDIQIPDIDGRHLFREFKSIKPDFKVLISSGYDQQTAMDNIGTLKPEGFIQKPYTKTELIQKIRGILC